MKFTFTLLFLLCYCGIFAQEDTTNTVIPKTHIQIFRDHFLIKAGITNRSLNFSLSPRINGITQFLKPIWYRPSVRNSLGIGANFKDVAISLGFKVAQHPSIRKRQGESKYFDLQVHSFGKKIGYDIYYQDYRGYFIENLDNLINNLFSGNELQRRDDINLQNLQVNVFYIFNSDKFSYRAAFVHDERQLKSAGSFILTSSLGYFQARGDSAFIPSDTNIDFDSEAFFSENHFYTFSITPGYAYTLVNRKGWYISAGVSGLIGLQYHEGSGAFFSSEGMNYFLKGIARGSAGYHGEKWIVGLSASTDVQGMNTKFVQYRLNNLDISVFLAHRFKTKWMEGKKSIFEKNKK